MFTTFCPKRNAQPCCMHAIASNVSSTSVSETTACCFCGRQETHEWTITPAPIQEHGDALVSYGILPQ